MTDAQPNVRPEIRDLFETMVETRRDLHRHPEPGFKEKRTGKIIADRLEKLGYRVERVAETGVVGLLETKGAARSLAFRADMDALPLQEKGNPPYKSQNPGFMHACGHDGHVAILLAFAEYAAATPDRWKGNLKLIFQPAEEGPGGAKPMIEAGVLENPKVDAVVGLHIWNDLDAGLVGVKEGVIMASADEFIFTVLGHGGHGAQPQKTVDAVAVAAQVVTALQTIVSRNIDPTKPAVLSIGEIHGGSAFNIIAQEVRLHGTVRTLDKETREVIKGKIEDVAGGVCRAMGADYRYEWIEHYPMTENDADACALVRRCAEKVVGKKAVREGKTGMGAEDMSYFLRQVPGCFFFLGSADEKRGLKKPHHHPEFDFDERVMPIGAEIFARVAEAFFE